VAKATLSRLKGIQNDVLDNSLAYSQSCVPAGKKTQKQQVGKN